MRREGATGTRRVRMVCGVQRVLMLPVVLLRAARRADADVAGRRCWAGCGVRRVRPIGKIEN